jgi:hypothetical protein
MNAWSGSDQALCRQASSQIGQSIGLIVLVAAVVPKTALGAVERSKERSS